MLQIRKNTQRTNLLILEINSTAYLHIKWTNLSIWKKECQFIDLETKSAASNEEKEAIRKEYLGWIWNFPEAITKRTNEELIERLQKRIEYLKQEDSNKTTKDDEG